MSVVSASAEVARAAAAAEHERVQRAEPRGQRGALGVGDDPLRPGRAPPRARASPSGRSSTDTAPSRLIATTSASALGPRPHQHADVLALADADRDQAADDVVDPLADLARRCRRGPRTGRTSRRAPGAGAPRRAARARSGCSAGSARAARAAAAGSAASRVSSRIAARGPPGGRSDRPRDPDPDPAGQLEPVADAVADLRRELGGGVVGDRGDLLRQLALARRASAPSRRPSARSRVFEVEPTTRPKWPACERQLVDVGARRGLADRADAAAPARSRRPCPTTDRIGHAMSARREQPVARSRTRPRASGCGR